MEIARRRVIPGRVLVVYMELYAHVRRAVRDDWRVLSTALCPG